jgi:hypothetical protein
MSSVVEYQQPAPTFGNAALILGVSSSLLVSGIQLGAIHTVPLLYTLPVDTSTQLFSRVHRGSAKISAPLAAFSATAFAVSAYLLAGGQGRFSIALAHAAGLILSSLLWARLAMKGVTRALLEDTASNQVKLADEMDQAKVVYLMRKWKWMSLFKGGLTLGGGLIGLIALATRTA